MKKGFWLILALLLVPVSVWAQSCPVIQSSPGFSSGGNLFGRLSPQWNAYFAAKADANNGTFCNPTIIGSLAIPSASVVGGLGYTPLSINAGNAALPWLSGGGSNSPIYGTSTPAIWDILKGTDAAPITAPGQQIRILYRHAVPSSSCFNNAADTGCNSPLLINAIGGADTTMVTSGATFYARGSGTTNIHGPPDVQAINAIGDVVGSGIGIGTGAYIQGRSSTSTGKALGAEISADNRSASDYCTLAFSGIGNCDGIWLASRGSVAPFKTLSSALHIGLADANSRWGEGVTINSDSVATTAFNDSSDATTSIRIGGTHTYGIRTLATAGMNGFGVPVPTARLVVGGDLSAPAWTSNGIAFLNKAATFTDTSSAGAVSFNYVNSIQRSTIAASSPTTYDSAVTLNISGCPIAGANVTITNCNALVIAGGTTHLGGSTFLAGPAHATDSLIVTGGTAPALSNGTGYAIASASQGLILGGQGSLNDFALKNSAGTTVLSLGTGGSSIFASNFSMSGTPFVGTTGTGAIGGSATLGGLYSGYGSVNDVTIRNKNEETAMVVPTGTQNAVFSNNIAMGGVTTIDSGGSLLTLSAPRMIYVGDSLTYLGYNSYISLPTYKGKAFSTQNIGINSTTTVSWLADAPTLLDPLYQYRSPVNIAMIWLGTNDIALLAATPATVWTNLQALVAAEQNNGFKVCVGNMISRVGNDTNLTTLNGLIAAGWVGAGIDCFVDFAANANLAPDGSNYADLTYYLPDQIHLNATGMALAAGIADAALTTYIGTLSTTPSAITFNTPGPVVLSDAAYANCTSLSTVAGVLTCVP